MYSYHYAFLTISLALMGLGLGGISSQYLYRGDGKDEALLLLATLSLVIAILAPLLTLLVALSPQLGVLAGAGLVFVPFFVGGIFLSVAYKAFGEAGSLLYFADLIGAAVGSLGVAFVLSRFDVLGTVAVIGAIFSLGCLIIASASRRKRMVLIGLGVVLALGVSAQILQTTQSVRVAIAKGQGKEMSQVLSNRGTIVDSRWSLFGRTDLVKIPPDSMAIFVDGAAGSYMYRFNGDPDSPNPEVDQLKFTPAYFPFNFGQKEDELIIGPGGGLDVLLALMAGVKNITAVEVNPQTVQIVAENSDYNGGVYTRFDNVKIVVADGRSFLKRTDRRFDLIFLRIPVTKTSQGMGGYSLAENYLFTTDSIRDYLDHLKEDGELVVVAHHRIEIYRLTMLILQVLEEEGLDGPEIMNRLVVTGRGNMFPVLILRKAPFTLDEVNEMFAKARELGFAPDLFPIRSKGNVGPDARHAAWRQIPSGGRHSSLSRSPPHERQASYR